MVGLLLVVSCGQKDAAPIAIDASESAECRIELDEFSCVDHPTAFKSMRITVLNPTHRDMVLPGWVTVPGASDVLFIMIDDIRIDCDLTFPPAREISKYRIILPPGERITWFSSLPPILDPESYVGKTMVVTIPYFKQPPTLRVRLVREDDGRLQIEQK